jgi:hypothetical protein
VLGRERRSGGGSGWRRGLARERRASAPGVHAAAKQDAAQVHALASERRGPGHARRGDVCTQGCRGYRNGRRTAASRAAAAAAAAASTAAAAAAAVCSRKDAERPGLKRDTHDIKQAVRAALPLFCAGGH